MLGIDPRAISVLKEIDAAVEKRLPSNAVPDRKRNRFLASILKKATAVKRRYQDLDELEKMSRKVRNVVDGFTVSRPLTASQMLKSCTCTFRYPLSSVMSYNRCKTGAT
jgi:hypothetical protein